MNMIFTDLIDSICGTCGREVSLTELTVKSDTGYAREFVVDYFKVYMCPRCHSGSVLNLKHEYREGNIHMGLDELMRHNPHTADMFILSPGPLPAPRPKNLPEDIEAAWDEVLNAGRASAWTAAELMCRKILMHVAVDQFGMEEGKAFVAYVKKFEEEGFFPRMMLPVIDGIRERGNRATHDLAQSSKQQAMKTIEVTHHVLRTIYEISITD